MHCAEIFKLCSTNPHINVFRKMGKSSQAAARKLIIESVLGTDMAAHFPKLNRFKAVIQGLKIDSDGQGESKSLADTKLDDDDRKLVLTMALHVADVNNPVRPLAVYKQWAFRVMDEFFLQVSYVCCACVLCMCVVVVVVVSAAVTRSAFHFASG